MGSVTTLRGVRGGFAFGLRGWDGEGWEGGSGCRGLRGFARFGTEEVGMREDAGDGRFGDGDVEGIDVWEDRLFWLRSRSDHGRGLHYWLGRHFWRRYWSRLYRLLSNRLTNRWFPTKLPIKKTAYFTELTDRIAGSWNSGAGLGIGGG